MKLFSDGKVSESIQTKPVLVDCDFLGLIYNDEEVLKEILTLLTGKKIALYPFTKFEFLREVFLPEIRTLKEQFIAQPIFDHLSQERHLEVFPKLYDNALLLSKVYAQQGYAGQSSFIDLLMAGLLMYLKGKVVLITGNKRHFPSCVFDILSILNVEKKDGSIEAFCILTFNQEKFNLCLEKLERVEAGR